MREAKHVAVDKEIKPALRQPNPAIDSDTKCGRDRGKCANCGLVQRVKNRGQKGRNRFTHTYVI